MRHLREFAARASAPLVTMLIALASAPAAAELEAPEFLGSGSVSGWFKTGTNGGFGIECLQNGKNFSEGGVLSFDGDELIGRSECAGLKTSNARGLATARVTMKSVGASTYLAQGPELSTSIDSSVLAGASISSALRVRPKPGVQPTPLVAIALPFNLSGSLNANGPAPHLLLGAGGKSLATVEVSITFGGLTFNDKRSAAFPGLGDGVPPDDPASLMLELGMSPFMALPVDTIQPFSVTLTAKSEVVANGWAGGYFTSSVSYAQTLNLGRADHVFDVPEGYTVDAPGLGIFDNRYVGSVPEPSTAAMLLAGLGLWPLAAVVARWRRARYGAGRIVDRSPNHRRFP